MKDRKGLAIVIADKMPPPGKGDDYDKPDSAEEEASEDDTEAGRESAASDIIAAVKKGDAGALAAALHDFYQLCRE